MSHVLPSSPPPKPLKGACVSPPSLPPLQLTVLRPQLRKDLLQRQLCQAPAAQPLAPLAVAGTSTCSHREGLATAGLAIGGNHKAAAGGEGEGDVGSQFISSSSSIGGSGSSTGGSSGSRAQSASMPASRSGNGAIGARGSILPLFPHLKPLRTSLTAVSRWA